MMGVVLPMTKLMVYKIMAGKISQKNSLNLFDKRVSEKAKIKNG